jgi:hypothetical protein
MVIRSRISLNFFVTDARYEDIAWVGVSQIDGTTIQPNPLLIMEDLTTVAVPSQAGSVIGCSSTAIKRSWDAEASRMPLAIPFEASSHLQ